MPYRACGYQLELAISIAPLPPPPPCPCAAAAASASLLLRALHFGIVASDSGSSKESRSDENRTVSLLVRWPGKCGIHVKKRFFQLGVVFPMIAARRLYKC